jgi:hypothetical protein
MGLFKPAWMSRNENKALTGINTIKAPIDLLTIAKEAPIESVRFKALIMYVFFDQHIIGYRRSQTLDNSFYAEEIATIKFRNRLEGVIRRLNDQTVLYAIATNGHSKVDLKNEPCFVDRAKNSRVQGVCWWEGASLAAVERLTDQRLLTEVANGGGIYKKIQEEAKRKLPGYAVG